MTKNFPGVKALKDKVPKDLGVKIVSEDEALWTQVRDEAKMLIENHEKSLKIQKAMYELAVQKISEEHAKIGKDLNTPSA